MKTLLPLLFVLLLAVGGCVTHVESGFLPPPPPQEPQTPPSVTRYPPAPTQAVSDQRITIDPALEKVIRVIRLKTSISPEGYFKLQLNVHNQTDSSVHFSYRVDWLDENGQPLPMYGVGELKWNLLPGETSFLALTAPTVDVKDFRVTFLAN
jgi:uncharacterized protein YcfL